jgi:hypothetical protein
MLLLGAALSARAQTVTTTVKWDTPTGQSAGPFAYSLNIYKGFEPGPAANATYKANLAEMKPGIVRWHRMDMIESSATNGAGWATLNTSAKTADWDAARIATCMSNATAGGAVKMVNIPGWPAFWNAAGSSKLDPAYYDAFANWCARLVKIVNVDQGRSVKYWEVPNEKDTVYTDFNSAAELGRIFNKCATAMKTVDSSIKVGGPAMALPWVEHQSKIDGFLSITAPTIDFVTYHAYDTGSTATTNQQIFDAASGVGWPTTFVKQRIAAYTSRQVETFHDEHNVFYDYQNSDARQANEIGMIRDALATAAMVKAGATGSMAWNECDGIYGKLANDYTKRPAATLYNVLNTDMGGQVVQTSSSADAKVTLLGVKAGSWMKLALINRAESDQTVQFTSITGLPASASSSTAFTVKRCYSWGLNYESVTLGTLNSGYTLPSNTVTILVLDTSTLPVASGTLSVTYAGTSGNVNLSTQGTQDWTHWGLPTTISLTAHGQNRKSGANKISDFTVVGADTAERVTNFTASATWTGGAPTASASATLSAVQLFKWWTEGTGFQIAAPADTTQRTLKLYCGTWNADAKLTATLSDSSAASVTQNLTGASYNPVDGCYTVVYKAGGPGKTLTVSFTTTANKGSFSPSKTRIFAATLQ